jgi:Thioredoxin
MRVGSDDTRQLVQVIRLLDSVQGQIGEVPCLHLSPKKKYEFFLFPRMKMAIFVRFMSPSCGACQASQQPWDALCKKSNLPCAVKEVGDGESYYHNGQPVQVNSVPSYKLFLGTKKPIEYNGTRKTADMEKFLRKNTPKRRSKRLKKAAKGRSRKQAARSSS